MNYEPRWDHDLPYGEDGQGIVESIWKDLDGGRAHIEDKRKRRLDNKFYIEIEHDPGRAGHYQPSGLSVSESELWALVVADTGVVVFVPSARLRAAVFELGLGSHAEETDGDCPTRGRLLSFNELIATVLDALDGAA